MASCATRARTSRVSVGRTLTVLWLIGSSSAVVAERAAKQWRAEPHFFLTGASSLHRSGSDAYRIQSLAAMAELRLAPPAGNSYASVFAEHRLPLNGLMPRHLNLGSYVRFTGKRWDTTAMIAHRLSDGSTAYWMYAGRLRYRFADRHRIGLEAKGFLGGGRPHVPLLAYYATLSEALSLHVVAGPVGQGAANFAASIELAWQLR